MWDINFQQVYKYVENLRQIIPETLENSSGVFLVFLLWGFLVLVFVLFCYYFIASESLSGSELREYEEEYEK